MSAAYCDGNKETSSSATSDRPQTCRRVDAAIVERGSGSRIQILRPRWFLKGNVELADQNLYVFERPGQLGGGNDQRLGNAIDYAPEHGLADMSLDWQGNQALGCLSAGGHVGEYFMDPGNTATYPGHTVPCRRRGSYEFSEGMEVS